MGFYLSAGVYSREIDLSTIIPAVATSIGAIVGDSNRGPLELALITNTKEFVDTYGKPVPGNYFHYTALAFLAKSNKLWCKRVIDTDVRYGGVTVVDSAAVGDNAGLATGELDPTSHTPITDEVFLVYAANPGTWNNNLNVSVTDVDTTEHTFVLTVTETLDDGSVVTRETATVSRVSTKLDGFGRSQYIENVFENSLFIRVLDNTLEAETVDPKVGAANMDGGVNSTAISDAILSTGWDDFSNPDETTVNILLQGGSGDEVVGVKMNSIAEARKDCIAVLDVPYGNTAAQAISYKTTTLLVNSSYSTLYAPWVKMYDQYNGKYVWVPPSGYVGAQMAYTDDERDPWFAAAGLNRGIIPVLDLENNFTQGERDLLYAANVNSIRKHPSGSIVIWGQKTCQTKPSALDRVNVRRMLVTIEKAITVALDYFLFDPNDTSTRTRITAIVDDYLRDVKARRGLIDYRVVCDDSNNTPVRIDRNELWVDIYIKPAKAAEFIQLQTIITTTGANFEEIIGAVL